MRIEQRASPSTRLPIWQWLSAFCPLDPRIGTQPLGCRIVKSERRAAVNGYLRPIPHLQRRRGLEFGHSGSGNPKGWPDGSRRSPRVSWGGDLRATAQDRTCTPAGCQTRCWRAGSRLSLPQSQVLAVRSAGQATLRAGPSNRRLVGSGTPVRGAGPTDALFRWSFPLCPNDHRLPSANPSGWPTPLSSEENVQTPALPSKEGEGDRAVGWWQCQVVPDGRAYLYSTTRRQPPKSEFRGPKPERRPKPRLGMSDFGFRPSFGPRISGFGFGPLRSRVGGTIQICPGRTIPHPLVSLYCFHPD
jgi:hypothetical protein